MPTPLTIAWLKACALVLCIGGGIGVALGAVPPLAGAARLFADLAFWPLDGMPTVGAAETRFFAAIGGGAFAAWGVMLWLAASEGFRIAPALTRRMILWSVMTWFTIDSTGSMAAGAPVNALYNVPLMLAFVVPLVRLPKTSPS